MTDEIYQNLVVGLDEKAPESVHLCLWPEVDEKAIDKKLENEMDLAYSLVKLGRSARNSANIKNRQPLSKMLISVDTLPEYYGNIVKEELNVKEVDLGANMNEYVHFEIKPNLPVLGKEYGITASRGKWLERKGILYMPTWHTAALLRDENKKIDFIKDLKQVIKRYNEICQ